MRDPIAWSMIGLTTCTRFGGSVSEMLERIWSRYDGLKKSTYAATANAIISSGTSDRMQKYVIAAA